MLVLGQDTSEIETLRKIQDALLVEGYRGLLVKDDEDILQETNEEKVLRLAALSRFVVIELSTAAGQIDELSLLARCRYTIAALHREGKQATYMVGEYDVDSRRVRYFPYAPHALPDSVREACQWAEESISEKERALHDRYPWR